MRECIFTIVLLLATTISFGYSKKDVPEGWASHGGGTTGGIGGTEVTVSNMSELQKAAGSSGKKIILVKKGEYKGKLTPKSDKSILGIEPGVKIKGQILISGVNNVIIRNIAVQDNHCSGGCSSGTDAVYTGNGAKNIWLDHLDICDGQDGNCDVTRAADFITITWCKFYYTYNKDHRLSNLIAGSDGETQSIGKLNITYAYCWWGALVSSRQPRGRFGKIHVINNLYTSKVSKGACASGYLMEMLIENNVFNNKGGAIGGIGKKPNSWKTIGNIGSAPNIDSDQGSVFTPPYTLSLKMDASEVEEKVRAGAGNTLTLGATDVHDVNAAAITKKQVPFLDHSINSWVLKNPDNRAYTITAVTLDGKALLPATRIEVGGKVEIPHATSAVVITFIGENISNIYVPTGK